MSGTVAELLAFMNLPEYTHVLVKYREPGYGLEGLGGGSPSSVLSRFGSKLVDWTFVVDGKFYIVVKKTTNS